MSKIPTHRRPTVADVTSRADDLVAAGMSRGDALVKAMGEARAVIHRLEHPDLYPGGES